MSTSTNITAAGASTDSTYGAPSYPAQDSAGPQAATPDAGQSTGPDPADLRLVIEDDQAAGTYVYKTIDRRTGEVVQQYPREQILLLREASDYTAGAVIKAKV